MRSQLLKKPDSKLPITIRCPMCGSEVIYGSPDENPYFPFCSERCKLLDLGKWLEEDYVIGQSPEDSDVSD